MVDPTIQYNNNDDNKINFLISITLFNAEMIIQLMT